MDEDKYPTDTNRRRFVAGVVGGASLIGVGTTAAAAVNTLTGDPGSGGGGVAFYGVENTDGPAPRGMPMIPVTIEQEDGQEVIKGRWPANYDDAEDIAFQNEIDDIELDVPYQSSWFQYCGVQTYAGIDPQADQDNTFRYASDSKYEWQNEEVTAGDPLTVSDFEDYEQWANDYTSPGLGKPAAGTWRSEGVSDDEVIPVEIIRSPRIERMAENSGNSWLAAATERGFMAHLNKCTHFCCVPGFATSDYGEGQATGQIYCQCHQSIYDPFSIVRKTYTALPRPD